MGHSHHHHHDRDGHDHEHGPSHHGHHHHSHAANAPHPAQAVKWSLLQLSVASRLALVAVVSGAMWAVVVGAMR